MDELASAMRRDGGFTAAQGIDSGSDDDGDDLDREPVDLDRELGAESSVSDSDSDSGGVVDLDEDYEPAGNHDGQVLQQVEEQQQQQQQAPRPRKDESKGRELEGDPHSNRRVSFADDVHFESRDPAPRPPSPSPSDSSLSSVESDDIEGLFDMGAEPLQTDRADLDREYRRISTGALHNSELTYVSRVALYRDRAYASGFFACVLGVFGFGLATYRVENKHHYIGTLVVGLMLTGTASACMMGLHYKLFRGQWQQAATTPFSLRYLKLIAPLEGSSLAVVVLIIWMQGWSWIAGLSVAWTAAYDIFAMHRVDDGTQFSAVLLEMASDLVVGGGEMRLAVRRAWLVFLGLNAWLVIWISVFVDTASSSAFHSRLVLLFLLFSLYWTTQVARSLLSYYVTGAVAYQLLLVDRDGRRPGEVQAALLQRSLSVGFGSVCAGALYISAAAAVAAVQDSLRQLCSFGRARGRAGTTRPISDSVDSAVSSSRRGRRTSTSSSPDPGDDEDLVADEMIRVAGHGGLLHRANRYAWARVSLRGARFRPASQEAWAKLVSTGVIGAVQTETADRLLNGWVTIFGCLTAIGANLLLPAITRQTSEIQFEFFMASFVAGASSAAVLLEPLRASIAAIFIAFAENPKCFAKEWPIVHHRLMRTSEMALFSTTAVPPMLTAFTSPPHSPLSSPAGSQGASESPTASALDVV